MASIKGFMSKKEALEGLSKKHGKRFVVDESAKTWKWNKNSKAFSDGYYDYRPQIANVVKMSPREYLERVAKMQHTTVDKLIASGVVSKDLAKKYADEMRKGAKFPIPFIDYARNSQEGRHRALAALELRKKKIPVIVSSTAKKKLAKKINKAVKEREDARTAKIHKIWAKQAKERAKSIEFWLEREFFDKSAALKGAIEAKKKYGFNLRVVKINDTPTYAYRKV